MNNLTVKEMQNVLGKNELMLQIRDLQIENEMLKQRLNKDKVKRNAKAHTVYRLADGTVVPGTTTITGLKDKSGMLVPWANKLGLEGIDSTRYTDNAAAIGTLAHSMVQAHLQKEVLDMKQYAPEQIDLAENSLLSYFEWEKQHVIEPIACEQRFVSEELRYGGTIDCYCMLDGVPTLLDFKTSKSIYDEHLMQLAAYKHLIEEKELPVERCMILRIGRDETEGFEIRSVSDTRLLFLMFQDLLNHYYHEKEYKAQKNAEKKSMKGDTKK